MGPAPYVLAGLILVWLFWGYSKRAEHPALRSVAILVLGDIGRSPRMMYHAQSFASSGFETFFVGCRGSKPIPSLLSSPRVRFLYLSDPPSFLHSIPFIRRVPLKVIYQTISIVTAILIRIPHPPEFILVQNPPSIPTLAIVYFVGWVYGSKVIIDWHNLGYSVLALKLGSTHPFVKIARRFEAFFGRSAFAHLFVTRAMRDRLVQQWDLQGLKAVLHDRPPHQFHPATPSDTHELFLRLLQTIPPSVTSFLPNSKPPYSTPFTEITSPPLSASAPPYSHVSEPTLRGDRTALVVSSTSWTPDEDFGMLLDALDTYERRARSRAQEGGKRLPKMLMVVTGKGPLKEGYMTRVDTMQREWKWVRCVSLWLEAEDYPLLLGSADLGICLHSSSSGLDLPMKVVDMFGCGLPVCALDFACLDELVKDGVNGLVFTSASQLTDHLETLLASFPDASALANMRASLIRHCDSAGSPAYGSPRAEDDHDDDRHGDGSQRWEWSSWEHNWNHVVRPLILRDESGYHSEWRGS